MRNYQEENFYISEHRWYWTPSIHETKWRLERRKLGGHHAQFLQELSRFYYHKMVGNKKYVDPYYKDLSILDTHEQEKAEKSEGFYKQLWDKYVPGLSPMEKGLNLIALLQKEQEKSGKKGNSDDLKDVDIDQALKRIPDKEIFEAQDLNEIIDRKEGLDDFDRKVDLLNRIAMVEKFGKTFDIKKTVAERRVTNSKVHKQKRMVEFSELVNSPLYQRILPNYTSKLLTKDLIVNSPVIYEESKQKIIMLVDYSGSMHQREKQDWVLSILADRLRYCVKEECEIFFSFFLTADDVRKKTFKFHHIYNKTTALEFFRTVSTSPNGGDTEVGHVVELIRQEIMNNKKLFNLNIDLSYEKPEILIINDGNDTVKTDKLTWKTNAITLYGGNPELEGLCKKTGGKFITVTSKMDGSNISY